MNQTESYILGGAILALGLFLWVRETVIRVKSNRQRDRRRTLETLLLPKEEVKSVCPSRSGRWILTNKRLIIQEKADYTAFPFRKIKKVQGRDSNGKTTASPAKMVSLTVNAGKEFTLPRREKSFEEFVKLLKAKTARKKKKKTYIKPKGSI